MAKNEFLPFGAAASANVLTPKDYENLSARLIGFSAGIAESKHLNTVWRQASIIASVMAQFIADKSNNDVLDNGDLVVLRANLEAALKTFISANFDKSDMLLKANNLSDIVDKALGRANLELAGIKITGATAGTNAGAGTPTASATESIAAGKGALAGADYSVSLGSASVSNHERSVALGASSKTGRTDEVSVGSGSATAPQTRYLSNVRAGTLDSDAVTVQQLNAVVASAVESAGPTASLAENGWHKDSTGLIIQWGHVIRTADSTPVVFPTPFASACFNVQMTQDAQKAGDTTTHNVYAASITRTGFVARINENEISAYWFAIGT